MSYTIERGKRVLELTTDDKRFQPFLGTTLVYVMAASSNNVSPRHYDWEACAIAHHSEWGKEIQVPQKIWQMGYWADGGSIKPWDRQVTGLNYVKAWKQAVKERRPIDGWTPRVSIWVNPDHAKAINDTGKEAFAHESVAKDTQAELYDAFKRLFPEPFVISDKRWAANLWACVTNHEQLLDAVFLYDRKEYLPFGLHLVDREGCSFLK